MHPFASATSQSPQAVFILFAIHSDCFSDSSVIFLKGSLTCWTRNGLRPRHNKQSFLLLDLQSKNATITMYSFVQRPRGASVKCSYYPRGLIFPFQYFQLDIIFGYSLTCKFGSFETFYFGLSSNHCDN